MLANHFNPSITSAFNSRIPEQQPDASEPITPWADKVRPWNPLHDDPEALRHSRYLVPSRERGLQRVSGSSRRCDPLDETIHQRVKAKIMGSDFPCVAARSVMNRGTYRLGIYEMLGSAEAAVGLCHDLYEFDHEFRPGMHPFTSFIAVFRAPQLHDELDFERALWKQLQLMHGVDARYHDWDGSVSKDPESPNFSFSIGRRAFYVVGLHPCASRIARSTACESILVFNPHDQFENLRATGKYGQLQEAIRARDMACQGSVNPMLHDFGQLSEARQYSGRAVPAEWRCPFMHHHQQDTGFMA
ncbi:MAG TPA: YqcI/YcgG family protein [Candidatus Aquabacterium excrementipullorum]|nr:YqcI/YcgG family protein [Candidatus Aquabacterium excrementipullorum]